MRDYSTSKYENLIAETADAIALDGDADSLYDGSEVAFDLVYVGDVVGDEYVGYVILRRDNSGFVWIEYQSGISDVGLRGHWAMLQEEYGYEYDSDEERYDD